MLEEFLLDTGQIVLHFALLVVMIWAFCRWAGAFGRTKPGDPVSQQSTCRTRVGMALVMSATAAAIAVLQWWSL